MKTFLDHLSYHSQKADGSGPALYASLRDEYGQTQTVHVLKSYDDAKSLAQKPDEDLQAYLVRVKQMHNQQLEADDADALTEKFMVQAMILGIREVLIDDDAKVRLLSLSNDIVSSIALMTDQIVMDASHAWLIPKITTLLQSKCNCTDRSRVRIADQKDGV